MGNHRPIRRCTPVAKEAWRTSAHPIKAQSSCFVHLGNHDARSATQRSQFTQVAQEQGLELARLTDELELIQSGLDSLSFAIIVARLENALGLDPFSTSEDALFPVTFGELVELYENAAKQPQ